MRFLWLAATAVGLGACFNPTSASGPGTDSAGSTTSSDPSCPDGSAACPCYGNGTCDAGLTCNATVSLCVPDDCDPGSENCTCNEGACLPGLECSGGVCLVPSATTDPSTDPVTTDPVTTDSAEVTTDPATTNPATTDSAEVSTDPVTTDSAEVTTDPTGTGCEDECPGCFSCSIEQGQCGAEVAQCNEIVGCIEVMNCCLGDPSTCADCCAVYPDAVEWFTPVADCLSSGICPGCAVSC